ncbi:hypothetical protein [Streptomyces sp. WAC 01438]|uniref:hypothetical protein n=1 Tax=Streptomyces sp. WAC 01438 TaxID=2203204 RepID=UPI0013DF17E0|nr:hypothetical protein [Streptomyces sp. WAC 01438]
MLGITIEYARKDTRPTSRSRSGSSAPWAAGSVSTWPAGPVTVSPTGAGDRQGPLYPINTLQDLAEQWVALDYQQTPHKGLRSPFTPGLILSPNEMYAQLMP